MLSGPGGRRPPAVARDPGRARERVSPGAQPSHRAGAPSAPVVAPRQNVQRTLAVNVWESTFRPGVSGVPYVYDTPRRSVGVTA